MRRLSHLLSRLPPVDPFRAKYEALLLSKLYDMGILDRGAKMSDIEGSDAPLVKGYNRKEVDGGEGSTVGREGKVTVGAMCRRRLAVVLVRLKMAETVKVVRPLAIPSVLTRSFTDARVTSRPSPMSSKATSELVPTRSTILPFLSRATWRTLLLG